MITDITDGDQCFTDCDWCLPNGSHGIQYCQPSKSCKNWWKNQKYGKKIVGNTAFADELPNSSVLLVKFIESEVIGDIDWLLSTISGIAEVPDKILVTKSKVGIKSVSSSASIDECPTARLR